MALKDFLEEAGIMKAMKHPNLVQLLGQHMSDDFFLTFLSRRVINKFGLGRSGE
jgi:hypothetical protein